MFLPHVKIPNSLEDRQLAPIYTNRGDSGTMLDPTNELDFPNVFKIYDTRGINWYYTQIHKYLLYQFSSVSSGNNKDPLIQTGLLTISFWHFELHFRHTGCSDITFCSDGHKCTYRGHKLLLTTSKHLDRHQTCLYSDNKIFHFLLLHNITRPGLWYGTVIARNKNI